MALDYTQPIDTTLLVETNKAGLYRDYFKRGFDILLVLALAPLVLPLMAILTLIVALDGGQPFYAQTRIGLHGRSFRMWKFRSMVPGAEEKLAQYLAENPEAKREWDQSQKLKDDPRITPVGRIIRKSSLDELPQLWNILRGQMSLVGPRPMMIDQRWIYPGTAYFSMRPGLSGYWQTSKRNESSFADRATYDTRYFYDLSLGTDLNVLLRTVTVVLRGTGY